MKRALFLFLTACSSAPDNPVPDAGGDSNSMMPTCAVVTAIDLQGTAAPNATVKLVVKDAGSGRDYTVAWAVTAGAVAPMAGKSVDWSLGSKVAIDGPEVVTATATISAMGCDDVPLSVDRTIDWTDGQRTLVVYNDMATGSKTVADYYTQFRQIPPDHLCAMSSMDQNAVDVPGYAGVLDKVLACAKAVGPHVFYVATVFGVPYLVSGKIDDLGNPGNKVTTSLDALLVFGERSRNQGVTLKNPIYQTGSSIKNTYGPYVSFGAARKKYGQDYFLVTRIDGADAMASQALVDRTKTADDLAKKKMLSGTVYVDGNRDMPHPATDAFGSYEGGEWNIIGVENVFKAATWPKIVANYDGAEFGSAPAPLTAPDALYYAGWDSYNNYNDVFTWNPGAIGGHLDSCSACNFRGTQSWSAAALRKGITATFGAVGEPYVAGMPEYDQFFLYLLQGASYAEAAYESTILGAWMMEWIGDPLYRPYAK